jgi:DNA-binding MarR family transcriptional regulator
MAEDRITSTKTATRSPQDAVPEAWKHFVRAHAAVMRQMDADLIALHGLTLRDYEVLLRLSQAPDRRMRPVDLAEGVLLTQSGITRLLAGLETAGWIERVSCAADRRVHYAQLTDSGQTRLRAAGGTHLEGIRTLFAGHFSEAELETLAALMQRLPVRPDLPECLPPDAA